MKWSTVCASALQLLPLLAQAAPVAADSSALAARASSDFWLDNMKHQGTVAYSDKGSDYKVFRNVKDYGAKGDGSSDDTDAINAAIADGSRCGQGCDSTTVSPALVYFPPGTYVVSKPIVQYYYTSMYGDPSDLPVIKGAANFAGIALIDSDPYDNSGNNWYTNQNNFYRQIRNFVVDMTAMPQTTGAGIHWQVAQATSLQNIRFEMIANRDPNNKQQGIFMDNGSGGFMTDLTFNGGNYGAFFGNQQFTTRNLTFNDCNTAIFMNWNWLWALKDVTVNNCGVGVDMANSPQNQTVGSVLIADSTFNKVDTGVKTAWSTSSIPVGGGALILDNVDFSGATTGVADANDAAVVNGGSKVASWAQGRVYTGTSGSSTAGDTGANIDTSSALYTNGRIFTRSKPQYDAEPASSFLSLKSEGATGDGKTDDSDALQNAINKAASANQILFVDHGAYVVSKTITIPSGARIVGEIWPLLMVQGSAFADQANPQPVFKVGNDGDSGTVEISDIVIETLGSAPGAILMEWNMAGSSQGAAGMWDTHFRIGGSAGTQLQSDKCAKNPDSTHGPNPDCVGAFLMLHITSSGFPYIENGHFWLADHELDLSDHNQIDLYNGRGVLIETTKGAWLVGTAAEHSALYQYNINNAQNVYMSFIQTEVPYYQSNPDATNSYFTTNSKYADPDFSACGNDANCKKAWGLMVNNSQNVLVYGLGLYSFFENYGQDCIASNTCSTNMVDIQGSADSVHLFGLSTVGTKNMLTYQGTGQAQGDDNRSNFASTIAYWKAS